LKRRTGAPWKPADRYGRELPPFTVNLVVRDDADGYLWAVGVPAPSTRGS
jgi:hypothetical protein